MDDNTEQQDARSAVFRVVVLAGLLLVLTVPARALFGDTGVTVVLGLTLALVVVLAYEELSGKKLPRLGFGAPAEVAEPEVEDTWRSERWVAEAVERGLRALDEWRLEQRSA